MLICIFGNDATKCILINIFLCEKKLTKKKKTQLLPKLNILTKKSNNLCFETKAYSVLEVMLQVNLVYRNYQTHTKARRGYVYKL